MSATDYVIGAYAIGAAAEPESRVLQIRLRNVGDLVQKKGGAAGGLAYKLTPQTITDKVLGEMRAQFAQKLAEEGVDADVQVVAPAGFKPAASRRDFLTGGAVGTAVGFGACWLLLKAILDR